MENGEECQTLGEQQWANIQCGLDFQAKKVPKYTVHTVSDVDTLK